MQNSLLSLESREDRRLNTRTCCFGHVSVFKEGQTRRTRPKWRVLRVWVVMAKPKQACPVFEGKSTAKMRKHAISGMFFRSLLLQMWWEVGVHMREGARHWHAFRVWMGEIVSMILEKEKKAYLVRQVEKGIQSSRWGFHQRGEFDGTWKCFPSASRLLGPGKGSVVFTLV